MSNQSESPFGQPKEDVPAIDVDLQLPSGKYHMREDGSAWVEDSDSNVSQIVRTKR